MCGIAGVLRLRGGHALSPAEAALRMARALRHRGPDDEGVWSDAEAGVALAHRRLSILDLTSRGRQPMVSPCGRYVVTFNGEIYNHEALRQTLSPWPWRGESDTETVLAHLVRRGWEATLHVLAGMFALAVWDRRERRLLLARDRLGEKPLHWGALPGGDFVFASELKALRAHPEWHDAIDADALAIYLRRGAIPAPHTIHRGIHKLRPGEWLQVEADGLVVQHRYWDPVEIAKQRPPAATSAGARSDDASLEALEALDMLEHHLDRAVRLQSRADVPVGAFLSGGVDSSLVVALLCRHADRPVRTFTVGFDHGDFDESSQARAVASHLGTVHTELRLTGEDVLPVLPHLPRVFDEPFADPSQLPTLLVSRLARADVGVVLAGDGGDELFGGYNRYLFAHRAWPRLRRIPTLARRALARALLAVPPSSWSRLADPLPGLRGWAPMGPKLHRAADALLHAGSIVDLHRTALAHWPLAPTIAPPRLRDLPPALHDVEVMALLDLVDYLPADILAKVDRATMAVGLEARAPLLDHRLVEFALRTPLHLKIRRGQGKWLLRQLLHRHVPPGLVERPKHGFGAPVAAWLRGPLRDWARDLLDPSRLEGLGELDPDQVRGCWEDHLAGRRDAHVPLWNILMLQAWWRERAASLQEARAEALRVAVV